MASLYKRQWGKVKVDFCYKTPYKSISFLQIRYKSISMHFSGYFGISMCFWCTDPRVQPYNRNSGVYRRAQRF